MRAVLIGGSGFIGSHTAEQLRGWEICVYDVKKPPYEANYVQGDLLDTESVASCISGSDVVFYFASLISVPQSVDAPKTYAENNVVGAASLVEAIKAARERPRKVVLSSSASVYGEGAYVCEVHGKVYPRPRSSAQLEAGEWEPKCPICGRTVAPLFQSEEDELNALSPYAFTKISQEWFLSAYAERLGYDLAVLRYFNVYGPGQDPASPYSGVITLYLNRAREGKSLRVFEDGLQTRDYVFVGDVAKANALAAQKAGSFTVNVGSGRRTSVSELAGLIAGWYGVRLEFGSYRPGDIRHSAADVRKAREKLGFVPSTPLEEGLKQVALWMEGLSRRA